MEINNVVELDVLLKGLDCYEETLESSIKSIEKEFDNHEQMTKNLKKYLKVLKPLRAKLHNEQCELAQLGNSADYDSYIENLKSKESGKMNFFGALEEETITKKVLRICDKLYKKFEIKDINNNFYNNVFVVDPTIFVDNRLSIHGVKLIKENDMYILTNKHTRDYAITEISLSKEAVELIASDKENIGIFLKAVLIKEFAEQRIDGHTYEAFDNFVEKFYDSYSSLEYFEV